MELDGLLGKLYQTDSKIPAIEKTAEASLHEALRGTGQVSENPFEKLPLADLVKIAQELEKKPAETEENSEEMNKVAFDMLGGQIMAHAMVHEFGLIKEAVSNGQCRVCKEKPLDVEGSSICSECAAE